MSSSPQCLKPAKFITPAIRQRLQERLTQARKLSLVVPCPHGQIDELLVECVIVDPGNTVYIGALLHHLRRTDRPRGLSGDLDLATKKADSIVHWVVRRWNRLFGTPPDPLPALREAIEGKFWEQTLTLGSRALCRQPQSIEVLRHLATACAALEHEQAELCYLQAAVALAPEDAVAQRQLARALTRQILFDDAAVAWKRLAEMLPDDEECRQTIKILCNDQTPGMSPGLLDDDERREIQSAVETGAVTQEQACRLFAHLERQQNFSDAESLLDRAMAHLGQRLSLLECREKLAMSQSRWRVSVAKQLGALRAEYQPGIALAESESARLHLQICHQRSERHPRDLRLQLHLGQLLVSGGNYSEAIKRLEPIADMETFRSQAITALAVAWYGLRQQEKMESCVREVIRLGEAESNSAQAADLFDQLKEMAVLDGDIAAAVQFRDRKRELLAGGTSPNTSWTTSAASDKMPDSSI